VAPWGAHDIYSEPPLTGILPQRTGADRLDLLHELLESTAAARPGAPALTDRGGTLT